MKNKIKDHLRKMPLLVTIYRVLKNGLQFLLYNSPLINKYTSLFIHTKYSGFDGHLVETERGNLGFGLLHYSLIRVTKPKHVLCIGSKKGFIPYLCALACKDNDYGHVDFVDPGYGENDQNHWGGIGFWKKSQARNYFNSFGVGKYITLHTTTSQEFKTKHPKKHWQYIYIDGDHSYRGVKSDYQLFWKSLDDHGFMSFHDIGVEEHYNGQDFGVKKIWDELKKHNAVEFLFDEGNIGLGILQKKTTLSTNSEH